MRKHWLDKKQKLVLCRNCNGTMIKGTKNKKPFYKKLWFLVVVFMVIIGAIGSIGKGNEKIKWDDLELMADYADYMSKYYDVVEAFEKWEDDDMNAKETEII